MITTTIFHSTFIHIKTAPSVMTETEALSATTFMRAISIVAQLSASSILVEALIDIIAGLWVFRQSETWLAGALEGSQSVVAEMITAAVQRQTFIYICENRKHFWFTIFLLNLCLLTLFMQICSLPSTWNSTSKGLNRLGKSHVSYHCTWLPESLICSCIGKGHRM